MNLLQFLEPLLTRKSDEETVILQNWRENIFSIIMAIGSLAGFVLIAVAIGDQIQRKNMFLLALYVVAFLWIVSISFIRKLPYNLRVGSVVVTFYALGFLSILDTGITGDGRIWLLLASVIAAIFIGGRIGLITAVFSFAAWLFIGISFYQEWLPFPYEHMVEMTSNTFKPWFNTGITIFAANLVIISSTAALINNLSITLQKSRKLTNELEENASRLQEQTKTLSRRSQTLEISAKIIQNISSILDTEQIYFQAAKLLQEEYDLLHVSILLIDQTGTAVSLKASSGEGGQVIPALDYQFPLGKGLLNWVISNSQARAVLREEDTAPPLKMRLFNSRSHAVLPLKTREKILGVLVLQSLEPNAFDSNTMTTLQILTNQIAIQLSNVQLYAERENALNAERRAYRDLSHSEWKDFLKARSQIGYKRDKNGLTPLESISNNGADSSTPNIQNIPIRVRGQVIGHIEARKTSASKWSPIEKELLETLAGRLESTLDTARLYEETQQQAAYDRTRSKVSSSIRESLDLRTILKTATQELRSALELAEVEIRLGAEDQT